MSAAQEGDGKGLFPIPFSTLPSGVLRVIMRQGVVPPPQSGLPFTLVSLTGIFQKTLTDSTVLP